MQFERQSIPDVILIKPTIYGDDRGYFSETFRQDLLDKELSTPINFIQDNESKSSKGVLRGLHYQLPPYAQTKLVRVIEGCVLDVAVDIRKDSPTFGQHIAIELNAENKHQLLIPQGFAHGFVVVSDTATFAYKVDNYYAPDYERGIAFDDKSLNIDWRLPIGELKLSDRDKSYKPFS
ncbi:MAG: dTDP-4-dehydrorhamnose 3,5-epimerase [Gammaproteobacteria bacterium]|nr:MAG: dTDP-4-dehydrorhamnose 3,5-epimerase [Gammaproteobacteria bacterium]